MVVFQRTSWPSPKTIGTSIAGVRPSPVGPRNWFHWRAASSEGGAADCPNVVAPAPATVTAAIRIEGAAFILGGSIKVGGSIKALRS